MNRTLRKHDFLLASHAGRSARILDVCLGAVFAAVAVPKRLAERFILGRTMAHWRSSGPYSLVSSTPSGYQNTVESAYGLLPRPPQTPAARFKRLYRK